jgi:hypothetical protein
VNDECAFCEESAGYTIVGAVAPYEVVEVEDDAEIEEVLDEGIFDKFKKKPASNSDKEYKLVDRKTVHNKVNGVDDEYSWYKDSNGLNVFILGDSNDFKPEDGFFDHEENDDGAAQTWFNNIEKVLFEGIFDKFKKKKEPEVSNKSNRVNPSNPIIAVSAEDLKKGDVIEHPIRPSERVGVEKVELLPSFVRVTIRGGHKQRYDYKDTVKKFK